MSDPFLGQIQIVGFNFNPRGWAFCDGQLLPIAQNTALFSLLGTTFGGDGRTTFAIPDLRGRIPKHVGSGPGLSPVRWGERGGSENYTLTVSNMPSHNHTVKANKGEPELETAENNFPGTLTNGTEGYAETSNTTLNSGVVGNTGGGQAIDLRNPYLGVYYCIATIGIFPSRS